MLIYVNQLQFTNTNIDTVFMTIAEWLKGVFKAHIACTTLKTTSELIIKKGRVKTFAAIDAISQMYSIVCTHPDHTVRGRQWVTEIGIKEENGAIFFSILLETSDVSTQVKTIPTSTRPKLISYLKQNAELDSQTVGLNIKTLSNDPDTLKAWAHEVFRESRDYPIVLVSRTSDDDHQYLVNVEHLQEQLLGLAQIYVLNQAIDSRTFTSYVDQKYAAWDGAINIVYPVYEHECYNKLFSRNYIQDVVQENRSLISDILSYVTHITNGLNKRKHFSPTDVRIKHQKDKMLNLKAQMGDKPSLDEEQLFAEALQLIESLESQVKELDSQVKELEKEKQQLIGSNQALEEALSTLRDQFNQRKNLKNQQNKPVLLYGSHEKELFEDEIVLMVHEILQNACDNLKVGQRRKTILENILANNSVESAQEQKSIYIETLKRIFKNYDGRKSTIIKDLKALNLEVEDGSGGHVNIRMQQDSRFTVITAKTPSDNRRVGKNVVQHIREQFL